MERLTGYVEVRLAVSSAVSRVVITTAAVLLTGLPLLAVTQPFLGGFYAPVIFVALLVVLGVAFWRGATDLHGHVRAGAETIVEALLVQARKGASGAPAHEHPAGALVQVHQLLPGLGEPTPVELDASSPAIGRSLAELNLRGATGATVLAIRRGGEGVLVPTAKETLQAGDVLALAGSQDAIEAARALLTTPAA
jgi:CPA2 family monovalent cation:H+ antiporter-2